MRKKTINYIFDNFFWYLLYLLPIFLFLFSWVSGQCLPLTDIFSSSNLSIINTNIIFCSLVDIFGSCGVFPIFVNNDLIMYFSYFIMIWVCHIFVDIIIFIPKFCHQIIEKGEKNYEK